MVMRLSFSTGTFWLTMPYSLILAVSSRPLGRLFDIDVFAADGTPLTRTQYGLPARRCIICGDDARACMRTRRHDYDELLNTIQLKVNDFYGR